MDVWEPFEIVGPTRQVETIAIGEGIRDLVFLEERFGQGEWRKLKGVATVLLEDVRCTKRRFTGTKPQGSGNDG